MVDELTSWKTTATEKIAALESSIKRGNEELAIKQKDLAEMSDALAGCEKVIREADVQRKKDDIDLQTLQGHVADYKATAAGAERRVTELQQEVKGHREEIERLTRALEDMRDGKDNIDRRVSELTLALGRANDETQLVRTQLDELTTASTAQIKELRGEVERRKEHESVLSIKIEDLTVDCEASSKRMEYLDTRLAQNKETVDELHRQIAQLESSKSDLEVEVGQLKATGTKDKHEIAQLRESVQEKTETEVLLQKSLADGRLLVGSGIHLLLLIACLTFLSLSTLFSLHYQRNVRGRKPMRNLRLPRLRSLTS